MPAVRRSFTRRRTAPYGRLADSMLNIRRASRLAVMVMAMCSVSAATPQAPSPQAGFTAWFCPMHPEVTAADGGRCRKCGMALVAGDPFDTREYALELSTAPTVVKAGVPVKMSFTVRHPGTGALIARERPLRPYGQPHAPEVAREESEEGEGQ